MSELEFSRAVSATDIELSERVFFECRHGERGHHGINAEALTFSLVITNT